MKFLNFIKRKIFNEMAIMGDVIRQPIRLDKDDIEFLYQFPPELWVQAIKKRYHDDLAEALDARGKARLSDKNKIKELAIKSIRSRNFKQLNDDYPQYFDEKTVDKLRKEYNKIEKKHYQDQGSEEYEKALENAGNAIAYYAVEKIHPHAELKNAPKIYDFKFGQKKVTITAKPFINRLIHKLEKTKGEAHDKVVGLHPDEHSHGQYGYDLQKTFSGHGLLPGATEGMQLITKDMAEEAIKELLKDNYQHYYGKLPDVGEEVKLPDGSTRNIEKEAHVVKKLGSKTHREDNTIEGEDKRIKLPTFKQKITMNGETIEIDMPFIMSTKYTKYVGPNKGNIGKRKDRIEIDPDDYMNMASEAGVSSGGSFTSNKNRAAERKKAFGVAGSKEEREKVIGVMEKYGPENKDYPDLYKDIVAGIMQAITQKKSYTGIRDWEFTIAKNNIKEIHDMILSKLENNISNKKYHGKNYKANQARRDFAKNATISILGQNIHGGETRRLRTSQMDAPEIIPTSLRTPNQEELILNLDKMSNELSATGRKRIAGELAFFYTYLKKIVKNIEDESAEAEKADRIIGQSADIAPEVLKKIFGENHRRKALLISAMKEVLEKLIFTNSAGTLSTPKSEEEANKVITNQILPKKTISAMVASFAHLTMVQNAMREEPVATIPTRDFENKQKYSKLPKDMLDPRQRAKSKNLLVLQSDKDWLALTFKYNFMVNAEMGTLLSIEKWINDQYTAGKIPNQYYAPAMAEIKHYKNIKK
jgi:hypothetical protein